MPQRLDQARIEAGIDLREATADAYTAALIAFLDHIDLDRWADPDDSDYDAALRDVVAQLAFRAMAVAYARASGQYGTRRKPAESRRLGEEMVIVVERLHRDITIAGERLDEWAEDMANRGQSPETIRATLERDRDTKGRMFFGPLAGELKREMLRAIGLAWELGKRESRAS